MSKNSTWRFTSFEYLKIIWLLKISNLKTPCHTAIRIVKKSEELDVKLDLFELDYDISILYNIVDPYFDWITPMPSFKLTKRVSSIIKVPFRSNK